MQIWEFHSIERVHRFVCEEFEWSIDMDFEGLERLTLVLKSSNRKEIAGEVENVPADAGTGDGDSE